MFRRCRFTVPWVIASRWAIWALLRAWAVSASTSASRSVSGLRCAGSCARRIPCSDTATRTWVGDWHTVRTAEMSSCRVEPLTRKPRAPAAITSWARRTSSYWVRTMTWVCGERWTRWATVSQTRGPGISTSMTATSGRCRVTSSTASAAVPPSARTSRPASEMRISLMPSRNRVWSSARMMRMRSVVGAMAFSGQGNAGQDGGARARAGVDGEGAADQFGPLAHGDQAAVARRHPGLVEADSVVVHAAPHAPRFDEDADVEPRGLGMDQRVADRLADQEVDLALDAGRDQVLVARDGQVRLHGRGPSGVEVVQQRRSQRDRRGLEPQFGGDLPDGPQGALHRLPARLQSLVGALWIPVEVDLAQLQIVDRGAGLAGHPVVQLPGDPAVLVLLRGLDLIQQVLDVGDGGECVEVDDLAVHLLVEGRDDRGLEGAVRPGLQDDVDDGLEQIGGGLQRFPGMHPRRGAGGADLAAQARVVHRRRPPGQLGGHQVQQGVGVLDDLLAQAVGLQQAAARLGQPRGVSA